MEVDGDLEVLEVPEAVGTLLDGGDLGVQALGDGVGDAVREVAQHVGKVRVDELGDLHDRWQLAVSGPEVPTIPELARPGGRLVAPELAQALLDGPRPRGQTSCSGSINARGSVTPKSANGPAEVARRAAALVNSSRWTAVAMLIAQCSPQHPSMRSNKRWR